MTCMALQQALLVKVDCRTMSRFSAILVLKHGTFSSSQLVLKSADAGRGTATREAETRDKPLSPQSASRRGDIPLRRHPPMPTSRCAIIPPRRSPASGSRAHRTALYCRQADSARRMKKPVPNLKPHAPSQGHHEIAAPWQSVILQMNSELSFPLLRRQGERISLSGKTPSNMTCNTGDEQWGGMDDADKSSAPSIPGPGCTPRRASGYGRCLAQSGQRNCRTGYCRKSYRIGMLFHRAADGRHRNVSP